MTEQPKVPSLPDEPLHQQDTSPQDNTELNIDPHPDSAPLNQDTQPTAESVT